MDESEEISSGPDLTEVRHTASAILKSIGASEPPVSLNAVYHHTKKTFNLVIHGSDKLSDKVDGDVENHDGQIFILYNKSKSLNRQRFSVAHELGHLHMGHVHVGLGIDLDSKNKGEMQANHFAAYLLMPPSLIRRDIKSGIKDVEELAKKYKVSSIAMWWQIDKSGLLKLL